MKEQRKFVRHNVRHLLDFFTTDTRGKKISSHMGRMLDLSQNGMKIESPVGLDISTRLEITAGIADNLIDDHERIMVYNYAIELGFPPSKATFVIDKSIDLFTAKFNFKEYSDFVSNQV